MAMAAPARAAAKKASTSAASKAKNVTPKKTTSKSKPPVVSRSTNAVATHAAKTGISTQAHAAKAQTSTQAHGVRQQQRVSASRQIAIVRLQVRQAAEAEQYAINRRRAQKSKVTGIATDVAKAPFKPRGSSAPRGPNPLMLILFTMAGVIILYAMITTPTPTSKFFDSLRGWVKLIYTSEPIFSVKIKQE